MMMAEDTRNKKSAARYVPVQLDRAQAPKGAVRLSKAEILEIQYMRLERCKSVSEKTAFRFGPHIIGWSTALTAVLVNSHFRSKFYLFNYGLVSSYLPAVIVPTVMSIAVNGFMTDEVLLQPPCMGCLEVRSGVLQVATSLLYCSIIAPISSIMLSKKYHTYLIRNNFQPNLIHAMKTNSFVRFCFVALMVQNFGTGALLRYKQGKQLENIMSKEPTNVSKELLERLSD